MGDARPGYASGRVRVLYEAAPIAMIVEQAGGATTTGQGSLRSLLDVTPQSLHEHVGLIFGSKSEIERVERHLRGG